MNLLDAGYFLATGLAGALARAVAPGLPEAARLRLGALPPEDLPPGWVWIHAVSVGELLLAPGLVEALLARGHRVHLSTGTPAGLELLGRRLPEWDRGRGLLSGGAFPWDDEAGVRVFLDRRPGLFLALETELWPLLLRRLEERGIPRLVVNGRLTARSRGKRLLEQAASRLSLVVARDPEGAEAFRRMGAPRVVVGGNLKADLPPPRALPEGWEALRSGWKGVPVVVAGNTVEGEEGLVLGAWRSLVSAHPDLKLILAPRKPARFEETARLLEEAGIPFARASRWPAPGTWEGCACLLLDTFGDLASAYGEGSVALVGGGWAWSGGHNPLEPARWGIPVLAGPGRDNFRDLAEPLIRQGLLVLVEAERLAEGLSAALDRAPLRGSGLDSAPGWPDEFSGALSRTLECVGPFLPKTS